MVDCLVGICSSVVDAADNVDTFTNIVGGKLRLPTALPDMSCISCGKICLLVARLYCPVKADEHRWIVVGVCPAACDWIAYRVTQRAKGDECKDVNDQRFDVPAGGSWGVDDADCWGDDGVSDATVRVENLALRDNILNVPNCSFSNEDLQKEVKFGENLERANAPEEAVFTQRYLDVYDEKELEVTESDDAHVNELLEEYARREGITNVQQHLAGSDPRAQHKETYERPTVAHGDVAFYKFYKKVQRHPTQCVRYKLGGEPLLMSSDNVVLPPCHQCGAQLSFELQLMSPLSQFLDGPVSLDFGTIVVFTCARNCATGDGQSTKEFVVVQHDPDSDILEKASAKLAVLSETNSCK